MNCETMHARVDTLVSLLAPDQGESLTEERRRLFAIASAIQTDLRATMPANPTPAGGVVVPLEPTPEMVEAGWRAKGGAHEGRPVWKCTVDVQVALIYLAMLAARPAAPTQSAAQTGEVEQWRQVCGRMVDLIAIAFYDGFKDAIEREKWDDCYDYAAAKGGDYAKEAVSKILAGSALSQPEQSQ